MHELSEFEEIVLSEINHEPLRVDAYGEYQTSSRLRNRFSSVQYEELDKSLKKLLKDSYVQRIEETLPNGSHWDGYKLMPRGRNYINRSKSSSMSLSNITNSNIALYSPHSQQQISINELDDDLKKKVEELQEAIKSKDKSKIKKIFSYIADKSVDVAIAILVGNLRL